MQQLRLHSRTMSVSKASAELEYMIAQFAHDNDLTSIELLQTLTGFIQTRLKYMLREERHPEDPDKKGDEA